jgi:hypothetical protein
MSNKERGVTYFYYKCRKNHFHGNGACPNRKNYRAPELEREVWQFVSGLLQDPDRIRQGFEEMIALERAAQRGAGDPTQEK